MLMCQVLGEPITMRQTARHIHIARQLAHSAMKNEKLSTMNKSDALVVFSGGQDSTSCLFWAKKHFRKVYALASIRLDKSM